MPNVSKVPKVGQGHKTYDLRGFQLSIGAQYDKDYD
jgi:hypothetical protein